MDNKRPIIILTGPTSVGKTGLSIKLAKMINGSIISADSMQVYKGMDIGTAKITKEEMSDVDHYLIDVLDPKENFGVATFTQLAKEAMETIYSKGEIPIIAGGTGFYIQALLYDIDFGEKQEDSSLRQSLEEEAKRDGIGNIYERLRSVDPASCEAIHPNNEKRVIRALEFYLTTGNRISEHNAQESQKESPYNFAYFVLNDDREKIYSRIDERVDEMIRNGLFDEVKSLLDGGLDRKSQSLLGIGYKEIVDCIDGKHDLDEAVRLIKRETRHYAKKQLTWFKREKEVSWINKGDFSYDDNKMLEYMSGILTEKHII